MKPKREFSVRSSLLVLSFIGFMINFMLRTDFNIAVVKMAKQETDKPNMFIKDIEIETKPDFDWSISEQANIQSAFYWWYFLSSGLSGVYVNHFSPKHLFGFGHLITAVGTFMIPIVAADNYLPVLIVKSVQGMAEGVTWPAFFVLISRWVPQVERNRFVSATFGCFIGVGLTYACLGYIIEYFSWHFGFYVTGSITIIWFIFWYWKIYDYPKDHPTISEKELKYIESNIIVNNDKLRTPWSNIMTSPIIWAIAIANIGRMWIITIFFVNGPTFLKNILQVNITKNGLYNGVPYLIATFVGILMTVIADYAIKKKMLSVVNLRRLYAIITLIGANIPILGILYVESAWEFSSLFCICLCATNANASASLATIVDIAPNFSGPIFAFCQLIFMSASFICPVAMSWIISDASNISQWKILFQITIIIGTFSYAPYLLLVNNDIQKWNNSVKNNKKNKISTKRNVAEVAVND